MPTWGGFGSFGGAGLIAIPGWATVTGTTGTVTTNTYSANGVTWRWRRWEGSGSITTTAGIVDVLIVGGGGAGQASDNGGVEAYGGAGAVLDGIRIITAGTHTVTVGGAGGSSAFFGRSAGPGGPGMAAWPGGDNYKFIGDAGNGSPGGVILANNPGDSRRGGGAGGGNSGFSSSITGSAYSYGEGGRKPRSETYGAGGAIGAGLQGTVIIRVPA